MKHVTEPSTVVSDLVPGTEYIFRVYAKNLIGTSEHSGESELVKLAQRPLVTEFSLDPFDSRYDLLDEIGR